MKKLIAILLALVLVLSFSAAALAEEPEQTKNDSITINNAKPGETYNLYKLFDLSVNDELEPTAYTYTVNTDWTAFFAPADGETPAGPGKQYVTINGVGAVTAISDAAALAKAAAEWAGKPAATQSKEATEETVVFTGLEDGYWLITSTLGTIAMTETTPDKNKVEINEKNLVPTEEKEVKEGDTWGKTNDANIGDTVEFRVTIHAKPGAKNYVLTDEMSTGLTYKPGSVVVKAGATTLVKDTDYTLTETGDGFVLSFKQDYLDTITDNTDLVVTYSATLNVNAIVAGNGNDNKATLTYGDASTVESTTKTYTWEVDVYKFTKNGEEQKPLAGAEFVILRDKAVSEGEQPAKEVALLNNGKVTGWEDYNEESIPAAAKFTTPATGLFKIQGLDSGTYYLHETKAPDGYNKLESDVKFVIGTEKSNPGVEGETLAYKPGEGIHYDAENDPILNQVEVENKAGSELPSTGGIGTTIFYVLGGLMAAGAAVVLIAKKRVEQ